MNLSKFEVRVAKIKVNIIFFNKPMVKCAFRSISYVWRSILSIIIIKILQNSDLVDAFFHQKFKIVVTIHENFILWLKHGINQQKTLKTRNFTLYVHFWPINQNSSNQNQNYWIPCKILHQIYLKYDHNGKTQTSIHKL